MILSLHKSLSVVACTFACLMLSPVAHSEPAVPAPLTPMEQAFTAAQWSDLSVTAQALARAAARSSARTPELKNLIDRIITARQSYDALDQATNAARGGTSPQALYRVKTLGEAADKAAAEVQTLSTQLARDYPAYDTLVAPFPIALKDTQALLRDDEALVMIHPTARGTYIFAVRHEGTQWFRTDATLESLRPDVDALRFALDPGREALRGAADDTPLPSAFTFPRQTAHRLYQQVFAPAKTALNGAKVVYVVASGPLSYLPLSVLVTAPPKGKDGDAGAMRKTDWLIKTYALATLPSVNSLKFLRQSRNPANNQANRATGAVRGFIGFGSPDLSAALQAENLARLPGAQSELVAMAKVMDARSDQAQSVFTGANATEKALRATDLSRARVIAFATHAVRAGELDGIDEPALILTQGDVAGDPTNDGFLTASEAAGLRLNADWVILSACNTASGRKKAGETDDEVLSGLARGFLASGAHSLIVSHWRVADTSAARLTTSAVRYHVAGQGRAESLRAAMLDMMGDRRDRTGFMPANWAAMVVVGEAR